MADNAGQFVPGDPRAGRPKGSQNKLTKAAKEAFQAAFDELGGVQALVNWGKRKPDAFYALYARLIPVDNQHSGNLNLAWPLAKSNLDK